MKIDTSWMNCLSIILPILGIRGLNVKVASGESRLTWRGVETLDLDAVVPVFHRILAGIDDQRRTPTHRFRRRDAAPVGRSRRRRGRRPRGCSGAPSQSRRRHRKNKQTKQLDRTNNKKRHTQTGHVSRSRLLLLFCSGSWVQAITDQSPAGAHRNGKKQQQRQRWPRPSRRYWTDHFTCPWLFTRLSWLSVSSNPPTQPPNHPTTHPPPWLSSTPTTCLPRRGFFVVFFLLPPIFFSSGAPHWPAERQSSPEAIGFFFVFFFQKILFLSLSLFRFVSKEMSLVTSIAIFLSIAIQSILGKWCLLFSFVLVLFLVPISRIWWSWPVCLPSSHDGLDGFSFGTGFHRSILRTFSPSTGGSHSIGLLALDYTFHSTSCWSIFLWF